ncbi:gfo/Idh/MocA family oxidoreductase, partial [Candidatus Poribacteria bacterium]|nr:gfo/Idh/MocA family oxidoreductase [Candidatus Poribacteria bacterium]
MSFRVGIVGTGGIAHAHAGACDALDDVELCAVADVSAESAQRFAEAKGVPAHFGDLDEMLRSV